MSMFVEQADDERQQLQHDHEAEHQLRGLEMDELTAGFETRLSEV